MGQGDYWFYRARLCTFPSKRLRMPGLPAGGADGGRLQGGGGGGHSAELQGFAAGGAAPVGFQRGGDGRAIRAIFPREEIEEALRDGLEGDLVRAAKRGVEPVAEAEEGGEGGGNF